MTDHPPSVSSVPWERLALLFDDVSAQPLHSRDVYLEQVCAGDAALHAELSALMSAADRAPEFLRGLADDVLSPAVFAAAAAEVDIREREVSIPAHYADVAAVPLVTGTRIRHFEVLAPLGAGGMGVVYRGRDHRLNRDVALKFLSSALFGDSSARQRLVREAQAASSLDDPHVCPMYAIEDAPNGGLCLVMGYCGAGTLRDRLRAGALPVHEANAIAEQIARGLACAHRAQLVHRDIKPANIGFAEQGIAKILDFGVAVRGGTGAELDTTEESPLAGTLPYMAPELLRGETPDAPADIWALGVVYYEMLTGRRPFVASTQAALLHDILERDPAPFARADGVEIPEGVVALVLEMLQKSAARRPHNGDALVQRFLATKVADVSSAHPANSQAAPALAQERSRPVRRWGLLAGVVGAVATIAFFLRSPSDPLITAPLQVVRSSAPLPSIAVLPFAVRGGNELAYLREGMVDVLTPALDATGLLRGVDPNAILGAAGQLPSTTMDSSTARALALRVGAQRYVTGSVVQAGASLTMRATLHYADGKDVARAQVTVSDADGLLLGAEALVRQLVATELRAPGDTLAGMAAAMTTSKRALRAYIDGERELRDARPAAAMAFFSQSVADDSLFALAWYRLARAARWSDVDSVNARATARAFALAPTLPVRLQQLIRAYFALRVGSPVDAERQLQKIVADYPNDVDAWMLLGEARFDQVQYMGRPATEATDAFRRVMTLDPQNREVTVYLMELAARGDRLGELDTLFQMYFRPNSAGEQPGVRATYLALHDRRVRGVRRNIDDPAGAQLALRRAGTEPSDLQAAASFATTLAANKADPALQLEGLLALATLDIAASRFTAAGQHWRDAALLDPDATLRHRALLYAGPSLRMNADTLEAIRGSLERSVSSVAPDLHGLTTAEHRALRVYLGGLLSARLDDTTRLMQAQQQLTGMVPVNRLSVPLSYALQGHLSRRRRNERAAIAAFERSMVDIPASIRANVPALGQQIDRFAHAEALRAMGQRDEARRWYRSLRDGPGLMNAPFLALTATGLR
ncbi:serine/threonine-protein kinase [Gemmatimonas sp.]|uniref:serine/threonine-protein kinase n=1 Tax=Gemmatimonas sp. TaxID=1962908 RepID=UPI00286E4822|nr:serine/threonine-protein kinase [Gemmatimonas sp.]